MSDKETTQLGLIVKGHIKIVDVETGDVIVDKDNATHYENLSVAICESLIGGPLNPNNSGLVYTMNFGNGGTTTSASGVVVYNPPNVSGTTAQLYNQTYSKVINQQFTADLDQANNNLNISHVQGKGFTDILVHCRLDYGEPSNQILFDNPNDSTYQYAFDEAGLFTYNGQLLTHVIFAPFIKSLNSSHDIYYTLRIQVIGG